MPEYNLKQFEVKIAQKVTNKFKLVKKKDSIVQRIIGKIISCDGSYIKNIYTVIGDTIYLPEASTIDFKEDSFNKNDLLYLMHELVHMKQMNRDTKIGFSVRYLMPQFISIIGILMILISIPFFFYSIIAAVFILIPSLISLITFIPKKFKAKYRTEQEIEAYTISVLCMLNLGYRERTIKRMISGWARSVGGPTYFHSEDPDYIETRLLENYKRLKNEEYNDVDIWCLNSINAIS
jgi:hypothetical protein